MTGSFLDELRAVREHVLAHATKTLQVPGSRGRLAVRFRPPEDRDSLTPIIAAYMTRGALTRDQELQLLVDCCDEVMHRNGSADLESLDPPLRFDGSDERWNADTARQAVAELYNLDVQPLAASGHAEALVDWLQGMDAEADAAVEREGKAAGAS